MQGIALARTCFICGVCFHPAGPPQVSKRPTKVVRQVPRQSHWGEVLTKRGPGRPIGVMPIQKGRWMTPQVLKEVEQSNVKGGGILTASMVGMGIRILIDIITTYASQS